MHTLSDTVLSIIYAGRKMYLPDPLAHGYHYTEKRPALQLFAKDLKKVLKTGYTYAIMIKVAGTFVPGIRFLLSGLEVSTVATAKLILEILFIIISIALIVVILMQEGKSAGLGAIAGAADTYWGKNKGRSMEGMLVKITRVMVVLFIVISAILNIGSFG